MPVSNSIWRNTPNKIDHNTNGYTSKVLFNFQAGNQGLEVTPGSNIIGTIISSEVNFKGTNKLPAGYFYNADGRTFKISMYYLVPLDGGAVDLVQELYDVDNNTTYTFTTNGALYTNPETGNSLVKYECYLTVYYNTNDSNYYAAANGMLFTTLKPIPTPLYMTQISSENILSNGYNPTYEIRIKSLNGSTIYVTSLVIEEIS